MTTVATGTGYPRFSEHEMARRRSVAADILASADVADLLVYGADRAGATVQWLTQWPVTREAAVLWSPVEGSVLFVQFANHLDNARALAGGVDVRWGGSSTFETVAEEVGRRPAGRGSNRRVGIVGPVPASAMPTLLAAGVEPVFLDAAFRRARFVKSAEELDWLRRGVALTDATVRALAGARVGMTESALGALVDAASAGEGGTTHIHYFAVTSMTEPSVRVPAQWPSDRRLAQGDVLACEISASWWGYPGQLLRTFTVESEPTPRYAALHEVATAAFDAVLACVRPGATGADLAAAARLIEEAGFTTCDDIVHGYGGGYLPPVVPGGGRPPQHDDVVLEPGMAVVVQPNVVTPASSAGVQTGELVLVTEDGHERLHRYPRGLGRLGAGPEPRDDRPVA